MLEPKGEAAALNPGAGSAEGAMAPNGDAWGDAPTANEEAAGAGEAAAKGDAGGGAALAWANGELEVGSGGGLDAAKGVAGADAWPNGEAPPARGLEGMAAANGLIGKADEGGAEGALDASAAAKGEA